MQDYNRQAGNRPNPENPRTHTRHRERTVEPLLEERGLHAVETTEVETKWRAAIEEERARYPVRQHLVLTKTRSLLLLLEAAEAQREKQGEGESTPHTCADDGPGGDMVMLPWRRGQLGRSWGGGPKVGIRGRERRAWRNQASRCRRW